VEKKRGEEEKRSRQVFRQTEGPGTVKRGRDEKSSLKRKKEGVSSQETVFTAHRLKEAGKKSRKISTWELEGAA